MTKNKILVIEDEQEMAALLKIELETEGYEVVLAFDGRSGLGSARDMRPDLIVLDVMLPVLDGYQVLEVLKKDRDLKHVPVIMLTAKGLEEEIQKGLNLGVNDYVSKPFHAGLLIKRIHNFLRE